MGPLLFLIYVNDVFSCISDATVKLFADDTNLFVHGKSLTYKAIRCINLLNAWFSANKLRLSLDKTCYSFFFGLHDKDATIVIKLGDFQPRRVQSCKYLGIIVDDNLN